MYQPIIIPQYTMKGSAGKEKISRYRDGSGSIANHIVGPDPGIPRGTDPNRCESGTMLITMRVGEKYNFQWGIDSYKCVLLLPKANVSGLYEYRIFQEIKETIPGRIILFCLAQL
jgi:hypothetical protein